MIPRVIYLDTNAVHEAGFDFSADWFVRLRAETQDLNVTFAIPQLVADEVSHALAIKCVEAADKIRDHATYIERVAEVSTALVEHPTDDLKKRAFDATRQRILDGGIVVFPNSSPRVDELVARAVAKVPPFQSGDKGFRDCVIIDSIGAHFRSEYIDKQIMVVSSDKTFQRGVRQLIECKQNQVIICPPKDAAEAFKKCFTNAVKILREEEEALAKRFLEQSRDAIFDYVKKQNVSDFLLRFGNKELEHKTIKRLVDVRPKCIAWVSPHQSDEERGIRIPILFGVVVELDLLVSQLSTASLFDLEFRLDQPGAPTKREQASPDYIESELTVEHTVHVPATVELTGNDQEPYEDLRLGDDAWYRRFITHAED